MMKNILKVIAILILIVSAAINYSCQNNDAANNFVATYTNAYSFYYGNVFNNEKGCFIVNMYDNADENIGVMLQGFAVLPSNPDNLNIVGTYSVVDTANIGEHTCLAAYIEGKEIYGTYIYNLNTQKITLITGGTFDVSFSSTGNYLITTNFTGTDYKTGEQVSNLHYSFYGKLNFTDNSDNQSVGECTEYDTAKGYYYGDIDSIGNACFIIDIHNDADSLVGLWIQAYTYLPLDFDSFDITGGDTYFVTQTGDKHTCLAGYTYLDDENISGTYIYDFHRQKFILVNGGTFSVNYVRGQYFITTNFTGKELYTGANLTNLCYSFTGEINFENYSEPSNSSAIMKRVIIDSPGGFKFVRKPFGQFRKRF